MKMPDFIRSIYDGSGKEVWRALHGKRLLVIATFIFMLCWGWFPGGWWKLGLVPMLAYLFWMLLQVLYLMGSNHAYEEMVARERQELTRAEGLIPPDSVLISRIGRN